MLILCVIVMCLLLSMQTTHYGGKAMFAVWTFLMFLNMSASYTLVPTCTSRTFGPKHAGTNYGMVFFNAVLGGPLTALLSQYLSGMVGYEGMFYVLTGFLGISLVITFFFNERSVAGEVKSDLTKTANEGTLLKIEVIDPNLSKIDNLTPSLKDDVLLVSFKEKL